MRYKNSLIILLFLVIGLGAITGVNVALDKVDNLEFCISCHYIRPTIYKEYKETSHYKNRTGVRAECDDCHVPKPFIPKIILAPAYIGIGIALFFSSFLYYMVLYKNLEK